MVDLDDEVFDLDRLDETDRRTLVGEAALLASLRTGRTGRMSEVVATIQTEQDRVIRSGLRGALVVQGGPGTGKTVAALHRAAYLLYAHRATLERRGVLVVGPNAVFLRYIGQVLPSLGETDVVLCTVGELHPGVRATADDGPAAAVVKGDLRMAEVVRAAVRDRQRAPERDVEVVIDVRTSRRDGVEVVVERMALRLDRHACRRTRDRAQALSRPHNAALWEQLAVREALDALWPSLTPERLIACPNSKCSTPARSPTGSATPAPRGPRPSVRHATANGPTATSSSTRRRSSRRWRGVP